MKQYFLYLVFLTLTTFLYAKCPLLIYYGDNASPNYLNKFKVVVLEPDNYNNVYKLKSYKYGYLSIGEIKKSRKYFNFIKNLRILKGENPLWKDSFYIDLKPGIWQDFVINYLIPRILEKGYNGIFIDTVDSLLLVNPEILVIKFINAIKRRFPNIKLFMNRGFKIANKVDIDAILFESTITFYDFKKNKYFFIKNFKLPDIKQKIRKYSIDYWYLNDTKNIRLIYKKAIEKGFKPFVSDITLHKLPKILYDEDIKRFIFIK